MELEELRRRLAVPKPVQSSSAETGSRRPEMLRSAATASPEPSAPEMNQSVDSGPSRWHTESDRKSAPATRLCDDEMKSCEPTLQQTREILAISEPLDAKSKLADAVDKVFRPVEKFRYHFTRLGHLFEPVEEASQSTLGAFNKIGNLQNHLVELGKTFHLVEAFTAQIGTVAENFEPMRPLHEQLTQLNDAFCANLLNLAQALEPVDMLKARTVKLFQALDSIGELQAKLKEVAKNLRPLSQKAQCRLAS